VVETDKWTLFSGRTIQTAYEGTVTALEDAAVDVFLPYRE
jgi:hypothetical protein